MTTNLAAIIEAAAEADYMVERAQLGGEPPFAWPDWADLPEFEKGARREDVTPAVTATLATFRAEVLVPLAERLEMFSRSNEQLAEGHHAAGDFSLEAKAYGHAIAYVDAATQLRKAGAL